MFDIQFESEYKAIANFDDENKLKYDPPVYEQRYSAVLRCLKLKRWSSHFKKIVEFGCAEMRLLIFLKALPTVEHILQVDIDESLLVRNRFKARPLICDYLRQRENQLQVDVYCGSIDTPNNCLLNTDVVIGIEIIEHLYPETIENVPWNIFGFMKQKIALFSTPNSECNVLFNMTERFRHDDHKFEWTREQFEDWGYNICARYPDYKVAFYGIGPGPSGSEQLGCCSQMALFVRVDFLESTSQNCDDIENYRCDRSSLQLPEKMGSGFNVNEHSADEKIIDKCSDDKGRVGIPANDMMDDIIPANDVMEDVIMDLATTHIASEDYRLICSEVFLRNVDERSHEQKILDEARFHLGRYMNLDDDHYDAESNIIKVPVKSIFELVYKYTNDINEFRHVMRQNDYTIDENDVFIIKPIGGDSEEEEEYYDEDTRTVDEKYGSVVESEEDWD